MIHFGTENVSKSKIYQNLAKIFNHDFRRNHFFDYEPHFHLNSKLKKETISASEQNSNMPFLRNDFLKIIEKLSRIPSGSVGVSVAKTGGEKSILGQIFEFRIFEAFCLHRKLFIPYKSFLTCKRWVDCSYSFT